MNETRATELVSVVVTCFNQGRFLREAISSVQAQTHPAVDLIVVDDGSVDETAKVCAGFAGVRYHHQPNSGLPAARNAGVKLARADYIVFLDADDRLLPHALQTGLAQLQARPGCAFVSGDHRYIDSNGEVTMQWSRPPLEADHYVELLRSNYIGMGAAVMYRKSAVVAVGGFNPGLPACEDYDLYLRLASRFPVYAHNELVAEYRKYDGVMSADPLRMLRAAIAVLNRQRLMAGATPQSRAALANGLRFWRDYYGRPLALRAAANLRTPGRRRIGVQQLLQVARFAPTMVSVALTARNGERPDTGSAP